MKTPSPLEKLSEREKIVFLLLGSGKITSEIARLELLVPTTGVKGLLCKSTSL
jgi:DNA-binding NarL/FixJ family response regulator